jgi:acetyl esterase/lipase
MIGLSCTIYSWFRFSIDAFFAPNIPFRIRCLMLLSQPVTLLTYTLSAAPWLFRKRPFEVDWIEVAPGKQLRALVFKAPGTQSSGAADKRRRPLHIDWHGGAFLGGLPEGDAAYCERVARETGAVVVSLTYRYAPTHQFPAAHDDADTAFEFLLRRADSRYGADASLVTTSGFSAGGTLALATAISHPGQVQAVTLFQPVLDLRLAVQDKPRPAAFGKRDPLRFMYPLFDSYSDPIRASASLQTSRVAPVLAPLGVIPKRILVVVGGADILAREEMAFVEHVRDEIAKDAGGGNDRKLEVIFEEKGFHGYLECKSPDLAFSFAYMVIDNAIQVPMIPQELKEKAFGPAVRLIKETHEAYGWNWP